MLVGTFRSMTLAELLRWAEEGAKTGNLKITRARSTVVFYFSDGAIRGSSSNDPPSLLGQFLVSRGRLSEDTLNRALIEHEKGESGLGPILTRMGAVSEAELDRYCAAKAEELVYELLDAEDAVFEFDVDGRLNPSMTRMNLSCGDLLMRGATRSDEGRRMRAELAGPGVVLEKTDIPLNRETAASPVAQRLYDAIDGTRSFAEIVLHSRASEFLATKFVFGMKQRGIVRIVDAGGLNRTRQSQSIVAIARALRSRGDYDAALDLLVRRLTEHPEDQESRAEMESIETEYLEKMYAGPIPRTALVVESDSGGPVSGELTSAESYILDTIRPGKWRVADLVRIAPMHELDIVRNLDRLRVRGGIRLLDESDGEKSAGNPSDREPFADRSLADRITASLDQTLKIGSD